MRTIHRYDAALFDLDGTLLDTLDDIADSLNRALATMGVTAHPRDAFRYFVGDGVRMLAARALPEGRRDDRAIDELLARYRDEYAAGWNRKTRVYDGIPAMLDALAAHGLRLGVLSNKPHDMTVLCVKAYLARWPFAIVLGQREHVARKPDPTAALEAAAAMDTPPARVLYLGDTATDMDTARAAGMFAAGCTWGFRPESELREHGAHAIVHHPDKVLELLG